MRVNEPPSHLYNEIVNEVEKSSKSLAYYLKGLNVSSFTKGHFELIDPSQEEGGLFNLSNQDILKKLKTASEMVANQPLKFSIKKDCSSRQENIPPVVKKTMDLLDGDLV